MADLYTATQAAEHATRWRRLMSAGAAAVTPAAIRQWASRGHLAPAGLDHTGRPLYAHADVARAEAATRARALRLVGIPETGSASDSRQDLIHITMSQRTPNTGPVRTKTPSGAYSTL